MFCVGRASSSRAPRVVGVTFNASTSPRKHLFLHRQQIVADCLRTLRPDRARRNRILELDDDADLRVVALHRARHQQVRAELARQLRMRLLEVDTLDSAGRRDGDLIEAEQLRRHRLRHAGRDVVETLRTRCLKRQHCDQLSLARAWQRLRCPCRD